MIQKYAAMFGPKNPKICVNCLEAFINRNPLVVDFKTKQNFLSVAKNAFMIFLKL